MSPQTPEQIAYERGMEMGRIEARLDNLENNQAKTTKILEELSDTLNKTTLALELLASESRSRADGDLQLRKSDKEARVDTAIAIREEKDHAAVAIREEKESTAMALSNEVNKSSLKWLPRNGWANYITIIALFLGAYATFYVTFHH